MESLSHLNIIAFGTDTGLDKSQEYTPRTSVNVNIDDSVKNPKPATPRYIWKYCDKNRLRMNQSLSFVFFPIVSKN